MKHTRKNPVKVKRYLWEKGKYRADLESKDSFHNLAHKKTLIDLKYGKLHFCHDGRYCGYCQGNRTHGQRNEPKVKDWAL